MFWCEVFGPSVEYAARVREDLTKAAKLVDNASAWLESPWSTPEGGPSVKTKRLFLSDVKLDRVALANWSWVCDCIVESYPDSEARRPVPPRTPPRIARPSRPAPQDACPAVSRPCPGRQSRCPCTRACSHPLRQARGCGLSALSVWGPRRRSKLWVIAWVRGFCAGVCLCAAHPSQRRYSCHR